MSTRAARCSQNRTHLAVWLQFTLHYRCPYISGGPARPRSQLTEHTHERASCWLLAVAHLSARGTHTAWCATQSRLRRGGAIGRGHQDIYTRCCWRWFNSPQTHSLATVLSVGFDRTRLALVVVLRAHAPAHGYRWLPPAGPTRPSFTALCFVACIRISMAFGQSFAVYKPCRMHSDGEYEVDEVWRWQRHG